ncbi:MAG: cob(I)yrinic acid a,c-diamide adenosyltransferase [Bacteroidetes bacterium]|nr:cob(I)yrinic acid a,c-diamide adenosyltransferase [Bacteroidota bacterium]
MKIYTKTGDKGETALFGGKRIPKDNIRIESYGTVDELNSVLGIVRSFHVPGDLDEILDDLQNQLFVLGADLATPQENTNSIIPRISQLDIENLEKIIDRIDQQLVPLKAFILPGGNSAASYLHFARTVCRRAERSAVRLSHSEDIGSDVVMYLNRLSDLLFVLARYANAKENTKEIEWKSGKR